MADKKQTKLGYSTQFPGITLGSEKKINDFLQTKIPSFKSPFEIQDFTNGLYQEALKRQQSRDRVNGRADMKRELIQKSETTKNNDEKYRLRKVKNTADLADLIKDFTKKNGVDIGDLDDKTTITQFAKDNPNLVPQINGFLNGNKSATSFGKEIGLLEANYWDKLKTNLIGGISKFGEGVEGLLNKFGDSTIPSSGKGLNDFAGFEKYMNEKYGTTRAISSELYKKEKDNRGNNEGLQSVYTTNLSQDLLNIGEGALDSAFTAIVPGVKAGMSAVGSTKPGEVIFGGLGQAISRGGGMINHIPGLKNFKASLPEQDQERFDAFIGNTIGMMLLGTKGKSRLLKPTPSNLKAFFVENMNPEALIQNFQENVLALPKKGLQSIDHGLSSNSYTKNKELFIKGVKPTVKGKQNITDYARFVDDGLEGIASIVKNKENLKFINDIGEESVGQLPKNLSEFSDAISQTKKKIYSEYDALAKNAGENGALVSTEGIINELKQLENNRTLRLANPGIDGIISNMKKGLEEIGTLSVEEAQTFSQHLNQNLKAFYKNGNANDIGRSTVEALVNNNLKKAIDESIENALGQGERYSGLKRQYGQLRNIEEEVAKRALVDQRKNAKNLFDLTDIYSANQVIDSLANLNPIGLVKGGATSLIKNWYKKLNDPNVQIKKLFENIDKEINQNGKLRNKGNRWTDTKEWINEKLGRKTGNSEKTEYTSTEKSSSITSPGNIRAGLKDPVSQAPVATTFSFSQRDIKIGGKNYHHKINDNSFKTKHIFNQEGVNKQYVDNFNNAIKNGEKYALIGKYKENDVKLYLNKNFGDHFVKHGGFAPENLVETINNYDAVSVGNRDRYIFEKELPNGKWLRAITTKNFSEITFFETKNKFKGGEVIERGLDKLREGAETKYQLAEPIKSENFKKWFGDWESDPKNASKVVNEKGEPLLMYHGSPEKFTIFDSDFMSQHGSSKGYGFYFSPDKKMAEGYGDLMQVYLDIKNPLSKDKLSISRKEMKNLILDVEKNIAKRWGTDAGTLLDNFGDTKRYGKDRVLADAIDMLMENESDVDVFGELKNIGGDYDSVAKSFRKVLKKDGIITPKEYIVFESNQIKSATDNIGTFDTNNPDIRYQKHGVANPLEKDISSQRATQIQNIRNGKSVEEIAKDYGVDIKIVDKITTPEGVRAYGKYGDGIITLAENIKEGTAPHELFHATFDLVDSSRKENILKQIEKSKGLDSLNAEEYLADSFSEYFRTGKFDTKTFGKGLVEKIKQYFYQVKQFITGVSKNKAQIKKLFDEILDGEIDRNMLGEILENKKGDATLNQLQEAEGSLVTSPKKSSSTTSLAGALERSSSKSITISPENASNKKSATLLNQLQEAGGRPGVTPSSKRIVITPENANLFKKKMNNLKKGVENGERSAEDFLEGLRNNLNLNEKSGYLIGNKNGESATLRISNHSANARNYTHNNQFENNTSVVIKLANAKFRAKKSVDLVEFVYNPENLTPEKMQGIIKGIQDWIDTGEYTDKGYDTTHTSLRATSGADGVKYQIVYHGSPYEFKQFDSAYMGKGAGYQNHGWGHYVAVDKEVGKAYSKGGNLYEVEVPDPVKANTPTGSNYLEEADFLERKTIIKLFEPLKDWAGVKQKIFKNLMSELKSSDRKFFGVNEAYNIISRVLESKKEASQYLNSLGYDGIHFFGGDDGEAYVIFDDNKLKILDRKKL